MLHSPAFSEICSNDWLSGLGKIEDSDAAREGFRQALKKKKKKKKYTEQEKTKNKKITPKGGKQLYRIYTDLETLYTMKMTQQKITHKGGKSKRLKT